MTRAEALRSVQARLSTLAPPEDGDSWVVFWGSRLYAETSDTRFAVAGNAPFIVDCDSGVVIETGTAYPIEHYVTQYEINRVRSRT
jgi:hypothetical protein